ncbi:MDR family MFS transporter [Alkalibacterium sp. MB6]|uniref:MDR family MFS transporter n=1 Tax=Alkalibacterium sp. MB6 TaxID=2081965 RepID=UPI00137B2C87|nr:MDR family MFS transporter [Alkalibacterium sp. MB6]
MNIRNNTLTRRGLNRLAEQIDKRDNNEVPYWLVYTALFAGALMVIMNQTAIKTALPTMITDLNVTPTIGQWTVSGYTLVKGIMVPITAFAMNKFRSRNLFVMMMMIFGAGSLIAGLGVNFHMVLAGTLLQGIGAGMVIPLMQTIILTVSPPEKRGSAMGLMGIVLGLGPTLGPAAGGWIVDTLSWQYIFFFLTIGSIIVIPLALLTLTDVLPMSDPTIDWISIRHSVIGFGLLLFGLSILGSDGFDSILAWLAVAIGGFFVYLFFKRNLHAKEPMLDVSLFKNKTFLIAVIITMLGLMVITGISNVMPIYVQTTLGRTATLSGLIVLPGGMFKAFISPFIGRVYDRFGTSFIGPFGALVMVLGTLMLVFVSETTSISYIILSHLIMSFGFGIFNIPITTAGMNALPDEAMGHGTSARQTVRQIGSSFAITLVFATMSIVSNVFSSAASGLSGNGNELSIQGIQGGFAMVALFAIIAFVLTFFIREEKTEKA